MSKKLVLKIFVLFFVIMPLLSGCTLSLNTGTSTTSSTSDAGVYKSLNKGGTWTQQAAIQGVNVRRSFNGVDILALTLDPSDNKAIYAGSFENGLFYSYDGADSWQVAIGLGKVSVTNVAVDPADKCMIYATAANKVFKSDDCSRTWNQVYYDNDPALAISSLIIDYANSANIFIGTSNGDIIKSSDRGNSWRVLDRFNSQVDKIVISPASSKIMFAGTTSKGIFRSADGGEKWEKLAGKLETFDGSNRFRDLVMIKGDKPAIFLATNYGLLKSTDDGNTWAKIELLTAETDAKIYSIAVNSADVNEIYYTTATTFYHSLDAGKNWTSKKLPTSRVGAKLLLDPKNPAILYMAAKLTKK